MLTASISPVAANVWKEAYGSSQTPHLGALRDVMWEWRDQELE